MLDDQIRYENSMDGRAGMCDDYEREREKILRGKILEVYIRK